MHEFSKVGIKRMYDEALADCFRALDNDTIDKMDIHIKIGDHEISIPISADSMDIIFEAIEECERCEE